MKSVYSVKRWSGGSIVIRDPDPSSFALFPWNFYLMFWDIQNMSIDIDIQYWYSSNKVNILAAGEEYSRRFMLFPYCYSVAKLCPTLCSPMNCSMPSFPVLHYLPVCSNSCLLNWWCHLTISFCVALFPPALNLSQCQDLFQWVCSLRQVAKVLELQLQHRAFQWIFRVDFL